MAKRLHSIRRILLFNIGLLIVFFLVIIISDAVIRSQQKQQIEVLIQNNQFIDTLNDAIEQYKKNFTLLQQSGGSSGFDECMQNSLTIDLTLEKLHPLFKEFRMLVLYSRIVSQVNESQRDLITEYHERDINSPDMFDLAKKIQTVFTVLTDSWSTLINHYLKTNNQLWIGTVEYANSRKRIQTYLTIITSMVILSFIAWVTADLLKRLRCLTIAADKLSQQRWDTEDLSLSRYKEFFKVSEAFNKMKAQIVSDLRLLADKLETEQLLHEQTIETKRQQLLVQKTKYDLLQAQINPHFLFNTLNMIIRTIQSQESEVAVRLIRATSHLLRNSIDLASRPITLQKELELLSGYLTIMGERNRGRITFSVDQFGGNIQVLIPSFTLQTLVENAINHGFSARTKGGLVHIEIFGDEENGTFVSVKDNGKGAEQDSMQTIKNYSSCHGLNNIIERLSMIYKNEDVLIIKSSPNNGYQVIMHLSEDFQNVEIINR